jgi:allantoin racemase
MLRLHIVNPNTTALMTQGIAQATRRVVAPDIAMGANEPNSSASNEVDNGGVLAASGVPARIAEAERPACARDLPERAAAALNCV